MDYRHINEFEKRIFPIVTVPTLGTSMIFVDSDANSCDFRRPLELGCTAGH